MLEETNQNKGQFPAEWLSHQAVHLLDMGTCVDGEALQAAAVPLEVLVLVYPGTLCQLMASGALLLQTFEALFQSKSLFAL